MLSIYNVQGQLVNRLENSYKEAGVYTIEWNGADQNGNQATAGVYFYELRSGEFIQTRKMTYVR